MLCWNIGWADLVSGWGFESTVLYSWELVVCLIWARLLTSWDFFSFFCVFGVWEPEDCLAFLPFPFSYPTNAKIFQICSVRVSFLLTWFFWFIFCRKQFLVTSIFCHFLILKGWSSLRLFFPDSIWLRNKIRMNSCNFLSTCWCCLPLRVHMGRKILSSNAVEVFSSFTTLVIFLTVFCCISSQYGNKRNTLQRSANASKGSRSAEHLVKRGKNRWWETFLLGEK